MDARNSSYCAYIYKNLYVENTAQNQTRVSACCVNQPGPASASIDFATDPFLDQQRREIKKDIKISGCDFCWQQESVTGSSLRNMANQNLISDDPYRVELLGFEYNVSPICNARCITCSGYYSSAWAEEDRKYGMMPLRSVGAVRSNSAWRDLDLSQVRRIYFNGGEPLLSDEMMDIMETLALREQGLSQTHVSLNTNGSIWPSKELLNFWQKCAKVNINVSIDSSHAQFDYIRYPLEWDKVSSNTARLKDLHSTVIACTVGVHNVLYLQDLKQWCSEQRLDLITNPAQGALSFENTSAATKLTLLTTLGTDAWDERSRSWIRSSTPGDDHVWRSWLDKIDQRRQTNWRTILSVLTKV